MDLLDKALAKVGGYKRVQIVLTVIVSLGVYTTCTFHPLAIVFIGWEPSHVCKDLSSLDNSEREIFSQDNIHSFFEDLNYNKTIFTNNFSIVLNKSNNIDNYRNFKCSYFTQKFFSNFSDSVENISELIEVKCKTGWLYNNHGYLTAVEEWNLVCDRNYYTDLSQILFQFGSLIGECTLSFLIDRYGRRTSHVISHAIVCLLGLILSSSYNFHVFLVLRMLMGVVNPMNSTSGFMYIIELFDSQHRTLPAMASQLLVVPMTLLLGLAAYYVTNWRYFQISISLASGFMAIVCFFIPESAAWLAIRGQVKKADTIMRKMAKWNGIELTPQIKLLRRISVNVSYDTIINDIIIVDNDTTTTAAATATAAAATTTTNTTNSAIVTLVNDLTHHKDELTAFPSTSPNASRLSISNWKPKLSISSLSPSVSPSKRSRLSSIFEDKIKNIILPNFKDLFLDLVLLKFLMVSSLLWFSTTFVFSGLMLSSARLGSERFLSFTIMALLQIPAILNCTYFTNRFGRRIFAFSTQLFCGIFIGVVVITPAKINDFETKPIKLVLTFASYCFIASAFRTVLFYSKELFPTSLRGTSSGVCQIWGRVGAILGPFAAYLLKTDKYWLPNVCYCIVCISTSFLVLLLPETMGLPLPQTVKDCHDMYKKKKDTTTTAATTTTTTAAASTTTNNNNNNLNNSNINNDKTNSQIM
ncbi:hypothetical protein HELRODRAFT_193461 [Helobdella robusta]|uniref:Major facilitator superfamily (MFS) profile domain-containing protein n=1 Tax=Helobdella robusta TaxID=6412 RepID=T1FV06_HELRO|nr:hypothetical protein HELRODRAFT_193461 [Helobdella robusta]ESN95985.1 hypothetical protein HELRODRAFT_193461 [Helobdella robusta]